MSLSPTSPEWSRRIVAVANELRLAQTDLADRDEEQRRPDLQEVLRRALDPVAPEDRRAFLSELSARFPTWDGHAEESLLPDVVKEPERPAFDDRSPEQLIARLAELAGESPEARNAIEVNLRAAGLAPAPRVGGWPREAEAPLRAALGADEQQAIDAARVLEVSSQLLEYLADWDRVVWNTWRQLAPESRVRRPQPLQKSVRAFVTGDPTVPRGQLMRDIGTLRQLISSLVSAVGMAGGTFASQCLKEISPQQIEEFVSGGEEKLPYIGDRFKTGCWNKYTQLATGMEEKAPGLINSQIVALVEQFLRGAILTPTSIPGAGAADRGREDQGGAGSSSP